MNKINSPKVFYSIRDAVTAVKERLEEIEVEAKEHWELLYRDTPEYSRQSVEMCNWSDELYLVYRKSRYNGKFYMFEEKRDIEFWLLGKFYAWNLEDCDNVDYFLEKELAIWQFHRAILKDWWEISYKSSKPFVKGWMKKPLTAECELRPEFSVK